MSRISKSLTKDERKQLHRAKMAGKKYDAARRFASQPTAIQAALARVPEGAFGRMVRANRHTLDPHTDAREIERRKRAAARINASRESRWVDTGPGRQTKGLVIANGERFNFSRRGNLVPIAQP